MSGQRLRDLGFQIVIGQDNAPGTPHRHCDVLLREYQLQECGGCPNAEQFDTAFGRLRTGKFPIRIYTVCGDSGRVRVRLKTIVPALCDPYDAPIWQAQ